MGQRTIIAGSRSIAEFKFVQEAVEKSGFDISTVISGTANGVDKLGELWARRNGIEVERYPAEWDKYGKSAGYRRNVQMAKVADSLIAVYDGKSRGTKHMIDIATTSGLKTFVYIIEYETDINTPKK